MKLLASITAVAMRTALAMHRSTILRVSRDHIVVDMIAANHAEAFDLRVGMKLPRLWLAETKMITEYEEHKVWRFIGVALRASAAVIWFSLTVTPSLLVGILGRLFEVSALILRTTLYPFLWFSMRLDLAVANSGYRRALPRFWNQHSSGRFLLWLEGFLPHFPTWRWIRDGWASIRVPQSISAKGIVGDSCKAFILVICGPPCAGKSYLLRFLAPARKDISFFEMDEIRRQILPGELHDKPTRSAAYRVMHSRATKDLLVGKPVALSATYMPTEHRAELSAIAVRFRVPLYVVQCTCAPEEAAKRFLGRKGGHAGADLTATRVKELSAQYERFDGALLLNTDTLSVADQIAAVGSYLKNASLLQLRDKASVDPVQWARHCYTPKPLVPDSKQFNRSDPAKLSEASVRQAKRRLRWYAFGLTAVFVAAFLGIVPLAPKFYDHILVEYRLVRQEYGWAIAILRALAASVKYWWHDLPKHSLEELAAWATFCLALAGFGSILFEYWRQIRERRKEARQVKTEGDTPRYSSVSQPVMPSDKEIFHAYRCRVVPKQRKRMRIPSVPVFFVVRPFPERSFSIEARSTADLDDCISREASSFGMDWKGFTEWRQKTRRAEYAITYSREYGLRCVGLETPVSNGTCYLSAVKSPYDDYMSKEHATNYCAPGSLPDMRRLFEGKAWDSGNLDLLNFSETARRYSMRISVTGLVLTEDDYFILQRRSGVVGHGLGSLAASVNGAADYYADCSDHDRQIWPILGRIYAALPYSVHGPISELELDGPRCWDLAKSALREVREEIGLKADAFYESSEKGNVPPVKRPFIGAAYNLRYGRDLNFYCCFRTWLKSEEITAQRKRARDRWEVENLVFLHRDDVTVRAIHSGELEKALPGRARHLLGVLYSWAVYANAIRRSQ